MLKTFLKLSYKLKWGQIRFIFLPVSTAGLEKLWFKKYKKIRFFYLNQIVFIYLEFLKMFNWFLLYKVIRTWNLNFKIAVEDTEVYFHVTTELTSKPTIQRKRHINVDCFKLPSRPLRNCRRWQAWLPLWSVLKCPRYLSDGHFGTGAEVSWCRSVRTPSLCVL